MPQQRQPHIVPLTASVSLEDRLACSSAGMDAYLSKPVRAPELNSALQDVRPAAVARAAEPVTG